MAFYETELLESLNDPVLLPESSPRVTRQVYVASSSEIRLIVNDISYICAGLPSSTYQLAHFEMRLLDFDWMNGYYRFDSTLAAQILALDPTNHLAGLMTGPSVSRQRSYKISR